MQGRGVRLTIFALLLVTGLAAFFSSWNTIRHVAGLLDRARETDARLDRLNTAVVALAAAQQAYVAPGQPRGEWLTRATAAVQQLYDESAALRAVARSAKAADTLRAFAETVDAVVNTDDRAREHLRNGQELLASELLYTEGRQALDSMKASLRNLEAAEYAAAVSERHTAVWRGASALGIVALVWITGLLALARTPKPSDVSTADPQAAVPAATGQSREGPIAAPPVDLSAAAEVCTAITRLSSSADLPNVLARASNALDARGLILWMGAGEELFPATAHGYTSRTLTRLGPIARTAQNATADAWRAAEMRTVGADAGSHGAIVAPLFGPSGCFGVLTAELRSGREQDEATRAITAIIAAQLSTVIAPWPAPSIVEEPVPSRGEARSSTEGARTAASA